MDAQTLSILIAVLIGIVFGASLVWFMSRSATRSAVEAATVRAQGESQAELSQLRERCRSFEEGNVQAARDYAALEARFVTLRNDLDSASNEVSRLGERASRVEELERSVAKSTEDLRLQSEELRRVSAQASQSATQAYSEGERATKLQSDLGEALNKLQFAVDKVTLLTGQNAALEEQVSRVATLEQELSQEKGKHEEAQRQLSTIETSSGSEISRLQAELIADRDRLAAARADLAVEKKARAEADATVSGLTAQVSQLSTQLQAELRSSQEKLALLEEAKNTLSEQFKNVANDLLEEKSKKFAEQNQANLGQLLDPLRLQITEFKGKVEEVYVQESKDRSAMAEQVRQLVGLNQALSQEAKNLTNALKGNTKVQGNWGELILERVLESSGLCKGLEYIVQDSQKREDGSRAQPDVVILLPENRKLVVDSKVSLTAYEEYTVAESDEDRALAMRRHLDSVRKHVTGLSLKEYDKLYGGGLDFVLMFVPIEPAFMLAIAQDDRLFMDSWERNVLLVSPSTLLFVVRTVAHLWRQEQQSRNAQDIARRGAELYDKLVEFVKDLTQVGTRLKQAQESYEEAHKRLSTGRGNVIRQAEMLRELGVKTNKQLPTALVEDSRGSLTVLEEMALLSAQNTPSDGSPTETTST